MSKPDNMCESCRWWGGERGHDHDRPYGTCRATVPRNGPDLVLPYRDPDQPAAVDIVVTRGAWPWTAFDDWCAKHSLSKRT